SHRGTASVLIVSKDTWKSDLPKVDIFDDVKPFDAVFVDEAHFLRNHKTKQSEAIYQIMADHKYALTGTPAVTGAQDFYGILHFLYPERFNSYWQFLERYFVVTED